MSLRWSASRILREWCGSGSSGAPGTSATTVLDNDLVQVNRDAAPHASAASGVGDRVLVAMGEIELRADGERRALKRGDVAVFKAGASYQPPAAGPFFEVAIKPGRAPARSSPELIPFTKNTLLHADERYFVYEERLAPGDTRPRHSHNQRVVIHINRGPVVQQALDGRDAPDETPCFVHFREPVVHAVTNIGDMAVWNVVIEFKHAR